MSKTIFSVIIPTYNSKDYICETLDSVLAQSYDSFEVLLIDDCSNDNIDFEIYSKYASSKIRFYRNHSKLGPNYSRNFALSKAKGDYILFLDSDDCLHIDALKILNERLKIKRYDFIYFGFEFVSKKNKILGKHSFLKGEISKDSLISNYFSGNISTVCWNKVYSTKFLRYNKILFIPDLTHGRDSIFTLNCCLNANDVLFISDVLYYSTVRENSFSREFTLNNIKSIISNIEIVDEISREWDIDYRLVDLFSAKHIRYILLVSAFRLSFSNYIKGLKLFFKDYKILVLFKVPVVLKNSLFKNTISILVINPFLLYPITRVLNKLNIKPY